MKKISLFLILLILFSMFLTPLQTVQANSKEFTVSTETEEDPSISGISMSITYEDGSTYFFSFNENTKENLPFLSFLFEEEISVEEIMPSEIEKETKSIKKEVKKVTIKEKKTSEPKKDTETSKQDIPTTSEQDEAKPLEGLVFVVDAGHGGRDPGAVGVGNLYEKEIAYQVSKKVVKLLKEKGATVYESRPDDVFVELGDRVSFANSKKPDAFISIHANASTNLDANGIETFYTTTKNPNISTSKALAGFVQNSLINHTGANNRKVKVDNFKVLRETKVTAILVELGFVSNKNEVAKLEQNSYQNSLSTAIAEGVEKYYR